MTTLFDKILTVLEKYPHLIKKCENRIMGKYFNFEINNKKYFLLIDDNYGNYVSLPWLLKWFNSTDEIGCYNIYKGEYADTHWKILQKDSLRDKKGRLTRLKIIDKLFAMDKEEYKSESIRKTELSELEEAINKLLENN